MTPRNISGIVVGIIVVIELLVFALQPNITNRVRNGEPVGFFSGYDTVIDNDAQKSRNIKFITIIAATIAAGYIITINLPNEKKSNKDMKG